MHMTPLPLVTPTPLVPGVPITNLQPPSRSGYQIQLSHFFIPQIVT